MMTRTMMMMMMMAIIIIIIIIIPLSEIASAFAFMYLNTVGIAQ
jgi:hypothetical protein